MIKIVRTLAVLIITLFSFMSVAVAQWRIAPVIGDSHTQHTINPGNIQNHIIPALFVSPPQNFPSRRSSQIATSKIKQLSKPTLRKVSSDPGDLKDLLGRWNLKWQGARHVYSGHIEITKYRGESKYSATIYLKWGKNERMNQEAVIHVKGKDISIVGYNPSRKGWNPDRFYVERNGDKMIGYSLDTKGQRGRLIEITRFKP